MATTTTHSNGGSSGDQLKTLVTIVTLITVLGGVAAGYGSLQQRLDDAHGRIGKLETRIEAIQAADTQTKVQLGRIETDLAYIRAWIEKQDRLGSYAISEGPNPAATAGQRNTAEVH